jgi:hypothetical protein
MDTLHDYVREFVLDAGYDLEKALQLCQARQMKLAADGQRLSDAWAKSMRMAIEIDRQVRLHEVSQQVKAKVRTCAEEYPDLMRER